MHGREKSFKIKSLHPDLYFWIFIVIAFLLGVFLRLYLITDQIILDDEWHGLNFSINNSFWYLLTHFTFTGANSIPLNSYRRLLFISYGWSELLLVLPSISAGIMGLIVFPVLVKRIFSVRVTIIFAFLLAFSPLKGVETALIPIGNSPPKF